jgi:hypothetical protein
MKRSSLHIAIGLAVTAFLTLGPVAAQARTDEGQGHAVHAPLATSLVTASNASPAKSKDDCKRDGCDKDHGDKKHSDDGDHHDGDHNGGDHNGGDHGGGDNGGHHRGDRCEGDGLLTGLLCLLLG